MIDSYFKKAYLIRLVEEKFLDLFKEGKIFGTVHTCIGQEFIGIAVSETFIAGDLAVSNHRGHGHYLSITNNLKGLIAELMGKESGCSKGIGGSQHLIAEGFLSNGIQGGMLPIAAGFAFGNKHKGKKNISFAFLGDGTLGEGLLYESLNLSSVWAAPILFILENNNIAQSTSIKQNFAGSIKGRIEGFGIRYFETSTFDPDHLFTSMNDAADYVRKESRPAFITVGTSRLNSHSKGDDNRAESVIAELRSKDPLTIFLQNNSETALLWNQELNELINDVVETLMKHNIHSEFNKGIKKYSEGSYVKLENYELTRVNDEIYDFFNEAMLQDENIIIIGEDIETSNEYNPGIYGGAFKVTKDLSQKYPGRVRNTPISEAAIIGFGTGMSISGLKPVVEIMFGDFMTLTFDQILQHAAKFNLMYGGNIDVPLIIRTPMGGNRGYGPTHSQSIEKHFLGIAGLTVVVINHIIDPKIIYRSSFARKNPVLIIENKVLYTKNIRAGSVIGYEYFTSDGDFPTVRIKSASKNIGLTIICYGGTLIEVEGVLEELFEDYEIMCDIFCPSIISEVYLPGIKNSISISKRLLIVEEGSSYASYGSELAAWILENDDESDNTQLYRIANNGVVPASRELEKSVLSIKDKIISLVKSWDKN